MTMINQKKGVNHIKTLHTVIKKSEKNNNNTDFLELYMLEKEKNRLMNEESNIMMRLDYIQNRIQAINNIYENSAHLLRCKNDDYAESISTEAVITTIQIEY